MHAYKESFYFNLQKFNEIFSYLTKKNQKSFKSEKYKLRLIIIGSLQESEKQFLDQIFEKSPESSHAILFFNSFDSVKQFFECLFETDPEIKSQKYISNFAFYFLGKATSQSHFVEILNFFNFFEKFKFDVKLNMRLIYFDYLKLFLSVSSLFSIKNLHFLEFEAFIHLFLLNI